MKKQLFALAVVVALGGCSSDGGDSDQPADDPQAEGTNNVDSDNLAPEGGGDVLADQRSGMWLGNIGRGEGVYVVDSEGNLYGLAIGPDGAALSAFGELGGGDVFEGTFEEHAHSASAAGGNAFAPQGDAIEGVEYTLNIVPGQTIESLDEDRPFALSFAGSDAFVGITSESLAGTWKGIHAFETAGGIVEFDMTLTFDGLNVSGATGLTEPDGGRSFEHTVSGAVLPFGSFGVINFDWVLDDESSADNGLTRTYRGVVYFSDNGNLIVNSNFVRGEGDSQTLSSLLVRQ